MYIHYSYILIDIFNRLILVIKKEDFKEEIVNVTFSHGKEDFKELVELATGFNLWNANMAKFKSSIS